MPLTSQLASRTQRKDERGCDRILDGFKRERGRERDRETLIRTHLDFHLVPNGLSGHCDWWRSVRPMVLSSHLHQSFQRLIEFLTLVKFHQILIFPFPHSQSFGWVWGSACFLLFFFLLFLSEKLYFHITPPLVTANTSG